jgi:hypothetical protein
MFCMIEGSTLARRGRRQAGDRVRGQLVRDLLGCLRAFRAVPVGRPVQRAEEAARRDRRVGHAQDAGADAVRDQPPDAALVAIPFVDDLRAEPRRERVDREVRGRSLDVVDEAEHVARGEIAQAIGQGPCVAARRRQRREQAIERSVLTEEEDLVLAGEVVIQVAVREVGGRRDLAHAGGGEAARSEDARGGPEDLDAPRIRTS